MSALKLASALGDLLAQLPLNQPNQWSVIETTAQSLANDLRTRDVEQQTALGKTLLPQTLTALLKSATEDGSITQLDRKLATYEILRVGANLCMDHDENRSSLLEAGFPQTVLSILERYADNITPSVDDPLPLSVPDIKIVKTAIGVLLNLSVGYAPVKARLISLEAAMTILKLSMTIYPPGSWLKDPNTLSNSFATEPTESEILESWTLRSGLSLWAWMVISELRDGEEDTTRQLFTPDILAFIVRPLRIFIPPYPVPPPSFSSPASRRALVQADFQALEECCGLLEALALDDEDIRLSLARGLSFPDEHSGVACLSEILDFIDRGDYSPYWSSSTSAPSTSSSTPADPEKASKEKAFDICKAAIIKAVIEVAGEEKNIDVLWDDSDIAEGKPGGEFVERMIKWIREHKALEHTRREDLLICASISLGNLVRRDAHATAIVNAPVSLGNDLSDILQPDTDIKVKHGVIGLLKHLAQTAANRAPLGQAGVIQNLASCGIWEPKADVVETVQVSAISVAKHLCNGNVDNTFALILPSESQLPETTALQRILALVKRSDSIAIKSEGTRVLVNAVKSLWASDASSPDESFMRKRQDAMKTVVTPTCAAALAQLIGRSRKYPLLINEGVIALSLLSTHAAGGTLVLDALLNPLPLESTSRQNSLNNPISAGGVIPTPGVMGGGGEGSPIVGPRRALDMLTSVLRGSSSIPTTPSTTTPMEVRSNICALVGHLGRKGVVSSDRERDVETMKESLRDLLECAAKDNNNGVTDTPKGFGASAKRALEVWSM
ncbi:hypothetical protein C8Q75DRAFT_796346 [Abortiporus biennis]|nr:hypothetical protein C8Q75DRAFT_796346 [Abortiporus biennis]